MLNVVMRTCDKVSVSDGRIFPKNECVLKCLNSLVTSLNNYNQDYTLHIIDDRSTEETRNRIQRIAKDASIVLLPERDDSNLNNKQKSRFSLNVAMNYIETLPIDELVYLVEDDYLHYPNGIERMIASHNYFKSFIAENFVGIFPQDFTELYPHPQNRFNKTYVTPCFVIPGPDAYFRTTWFTHESFLIPVELFIKYKTHFRRLLDIGSIDGEWEGSTISNVWSKEDVCMLMPMMKPFAIHVSKREDIPFYNTDFDELWNNQQFKL